MADQFPLPPTVESLIQQICHQQSQPPPEAQARQELASLGEEASLRLLTDISRTKINRTFHGFILFLARQYRSPGSPGNFSSPPPTEVVLPESVEELIGSICRDQSQPPLGMSAKRKLESLGEEEALRLLNTIHRSKITKSFDGFVMHLAKSDSPNPSPSPPMQQSVFSSPSRAPSSAASLCSPNVRALDEGAYSVQDRLTLSPAPTARQAGGQTFLHYEGSFSVQDHLTLSPVPTARQPGGQTFLPYEGTYSMQDRLSLSPAPTARQPGGQTFLPYEGTYSVPDPLTLSPAPTARQPWGQTFLPYEGISSVQDRLTVSPAPTTRQPGGETFLPYGGTSSVQDCLTLTPVPTARQPGGQTFLPCTNNRQSNEHAPSPATNIGIPNGHTLHLSTSIGTPNGQFMGPPTNILTPNGHALVPSMYDASKPNVPCATVGEPNGQCLASSTNVLMSNAQAFAPSMNDWRPNGHTLFPSTSNGKPNRQCLVPSTNGLKPNAQALVPSMNAWKPDGQTSSPVLQALHELEFRKAFLILSYLGRNRNKLEEVTSPSEIRSLAVKPMGVFENIIWDRFGSRYCENKDRVKHLDWESGKRYYYHCYICSDGSYSLKGPYLNKTATLLQKVLGDENVLLVKFYNLNSPSESVDSSVLTRFHMVAEEGIFVGLKHFKFFVFKDGGKEERNNSGSGATKSYFVNVDSFARFYENKASCFDVISMHDRRCIFMHVHNVSSLSAYMARFSLILSKTITLDVDLDDSDVLVEVIDDIPCKDDNGLPKYDPDGKLQIHTDGTGFISEELALKCPRNCFKGNSPDGEFLERYLDTVRRGNASTGQFKLDMLQPPLLIQFRMFYKGRAVKGTVLVNKKLQGKKIQIRPSMIKVEPDQGISRITAVNSFEIVTTSSRPRKPRLSQFLIALLNYGGVPRDFFINMLVNEIWHVHNSLSNKRAALKVAIMYGDIDDNYTVARMILSGIPHDEPHIQYRMPILVKQELDHLKKGKLLLDDSFYVMGTADPTDSLKCNEVCVIHETGQIEGDVLVYRHPGVHFGDVHILKATRVEAMEDFVGTSKYGIFFPTKGPRSLADKMAGGDFDGDMFLVSRHPTLLTTFKQSEPWTPTPICSQSTLLNRKPAEFTEEELEHVLFQLFLTTRFQPSNSAGQAAHAWLCYMDQLLSSDEQKDDKLRLEDKMRRLVDIYYEALDAPKKGKKVKVPHDLDPIKYPHFMERKPKFTYISRSVLGEIYDKVDEIKMEAPPVKVRKLPCFEIEVPLRCMSSWEDHYKCYRKEMREALQSNSESREDAANGVIQKYKQMLYGADEFEKSPRAWEEIRFDALGLYHAAYGYAMQAGARYCGVAWRVAGPALMKIFMEEQNEKPILCSPSVLREIL